MVTHADRLKYSLGLIANTCASLNNFINYSIEKTTSDMAILMCWNSYFFPIK